MATYPSDLEYEVALISEVRDEGSNGWSIKRDDGWSYFVSPDSPVIPQPGMEARFYGRGIGYPVRGLFIDGQQVFYRTAEQEEQRHKEWCDEKNREDKYEFEQNRADYDRRIAAMPEVFQRRFAKFRRNNPDFRWRYEKYELFCCEQAIAIAALVKADEIGKFSDLPWEDQLKRVPGLSDGHSGNTFGAACRLAYLYQTEPEAVVKLYGALAPLVGSEEYGCVPRKSQ